LTDTSGAPVHCYGGCPNYSTTGVPEPGAVFYFFPTDVSNCAITATGDPSSGTYFPVVSVFRDQGIPASGDNIAVAAAGPTGSSGSIAPQSNVPFSVAVYC
jgi:hypothetical protein